MNNYYHQTNQTFKLGRGDELDYNVTIACASSKLKTGESHRKKDVDFIPLGKHLETRSSIRGRKITKGYDCKSGNHGGNYLIQQKNENV